MHTWFLRRAGRAEPVVAFGIDWDGQGGRNRDAGREDRRWGCSKDVLEGFGGERGELEGCGDYIDGWLRSYVKEEK